MSKREITHWSEFVEGDKWNHLRAVRFDDTDGYIGITSGEDRVLLTPEQIKALLEFIARRSKR